MAKKILIVEDEDHIRDLLVQTIETAFELFVFNDKLEILEASNGEEGLNIVEKDCPNLIFLDVMMSKINGFDVCRRIKGNAKISNKPYIVLLTAKGQEFDKKKGFSVGADEYMTKPFNPEQVILKVESKLTIKRNNY